MDEKKFVPSEHFIKLKGKDYLQVMWRLVWFRQDHPDWDISTHMEFYDPEANQAIFAAHISNSEGLHVSTGYGSETAKDFGDFIEKAETKAIGRALAILGYGTQFAPEMAEGDDEDHQRLADSPVDPRAKHKVMCSACGKEIKGAKSGDTILTADDVIKRSTQKFGKPLCVKCSKEQKNENR